MLVQFIFYPAHIIDAYTGKFGDFFFREPLGIQQSNYSFVLLQNYTFIKACKK